MGAIKMTSLLAAALAVAGCGSGSHASSSSAGNPAAAAHAGSPSRPESAINPIFSQRYTQAPASEQTRPRVTPASGSTTTVFTLALTTHEPLGPVGTARRAYLILLRGPHPRCAVFTELTLGRRGERASVALRPPIELGWCRGTMRGQVLLQTSPSCAPSAGGGAPRCAHFASRLAQTGRFSFTVR